MYDDNSFEEKAPLTEKQRDRRMLALLGLELTGLIAAAVAIGLFMASCGEKQEVASGPNQPAPESAPTTVATVASTLPPQSRESGIVSSVDSLPPEVSASVSDTLVTPGSAIEVIAEASVDATELSLKDDFGTRQRFTYDQQGKIWRAFYRVPLKSVDRLGLSVTAKNGSDRWRRVWVFLRVERASEEAVEDSTK